MDLVEEVLNDLKLGKLIEEDRVEYVCRLAVGVLRNEPTVLRIQSPISICGDVHGNFDDLLEIFDTIGQPPETRYLFLGDYVDRGEKSVETLLYLLCAKILFPDNFYILRGNHETQQQPLTFGFYNEILMKYSSVDIWKMFVETFMTMPLCAVVDSQIFCVHGGLSPMLTSISQLDVMDRFFDNPPTQSIMLDLLWSDPYEGLGYSTSPRQAGYQWGEDISKKFCEENHLKFIVRGHQQQAGGFALTHNGLVLTVFSSPNYVGQYSEAAVLEVISPIEQQLTRIRSSEWTKKLYSTITKPIYSSV